MLSFTEKKQLEVVKRAKALWGKDVNHGSLMMDLESVELSGVHLDYDALLAAPDGGFGHDIGGIIRHIRPQQLPWQADRLLPSPLHREGLSHADQDAHASPRSRRSQSRRQRSQSRLCPTALLREGQRGHREGLLPDARASLRIGATVTRLCHRS